jgi:hypothetical protein
MCTINSQKQRRTVSAQLFCRSKAIGSLRFPPETSCRWLIENSKNSQQCTALRYRPLSTSYESFVRGTADNELRHSGREARRKSPDRNSL